MISFRIRTVTATERAIRLDPGVISAAALAGSGG